MSKVNAVVGARQKGVSRQKISRGVVNKVGRAAFV